MGELIFLKHRRELKERLAAAKKMEDAEARSRRASINRLLGYADENCNWGNEEDET